MTRAGARRGRGLPDYLQSYLQAEVRAWIAAEPGRTGEQLAELVGVTPAQISTLKGHGRGAGWGTAQGMVTVLGITIDELEARAKAAWDASKNQAGLRLVTSETGMTNGDMPGWAESEKLARNRSGLLDWTFEAARRRTGLVPKNGVTPEYVTDEAVQVMRYASPDEVLQKTNEEIGRKADTLAARKRSGQKAPKPVPKKTGK